jgi:anti-sigma B factor antagonist
MSVSLRGSGLDVNHIEGGIVVRFSRCPALDAAAIGDVTAQLTRLVEGQRPRLLVLDFHDVRHLSAAALGTFVNLNNRLGGMGGRLVLTNLSAQLHELFEVTQLHTLLDVRTGAGTEARCHLSA